MSSDRTLNATVTELIQIGMGAKMDVRQALIDLLDREFPDSAITACKT